MCPEHRNWYAPLTMKRVPFLLHCGLELLSSLEIFARNMFMFSNGRKMSARWCLIIQSHPLLTYCNTFIVSKYLFQKKSGVAFSLFVSFVFPFPFRPHLALEYSGKVCKNRIFEPIEYYNSSVSFKIIHLCFFQATKIHQRAFGNDHPITARSLELMATVYAEIGKTEYSGKG